jgi:large subunit ribosomal protein L13
LGVSSAVTKEIWFFLLPRLKRGFPFLDKGKFFVIIKFMKTTFLKSENEVKRNWYLVDMTNKTLGRAASKIARILSGKNKVTYTPHIDGGDFVVAINAKKIRVTGKKLLNKVYYHHTGYPGGLKKKSLAELLAKKPEEVLRLAVKRMLPKNRLGRRMLKRLKIYPDEKHPHRAQRPVMIEL